jgi:hypothetical protein
MLQQIQRHDRKTEATHCPVTVKFEYAMSNERSWNYERMVLQLEDCVDVVKLLFPQYDCLFLFDHSSCDKQRIAGLNTENMFKVYGGKQSKLLDAKK